MYASGLQGQRIERVTVYPSDYGLAHMAEEARLGPRAIFAPRPAARVGNSNGAPTGPPDSNADEAPQLQSGEEEEEEEGRGAAGGSARGDGGGHEEGAEVDQARLRAYERSKLRYYYAVVVCDGVPTAAHLYRKCDGLEFELTANRCALQYTACVLPAPEMLCKTSASSAGAPPAA